MIVSVFVFVARARASDHDWNVWNYWNHWNDRNLVTNILKSITHLDTNVSRKTNKEGTRSWPIYPELH